MLQVKEEPDPIEFDDDDIFLPLNNENDTKLASIALVYTKRLDEMLVFKNYSTTLNIHELMNSIEKESKPTLKSLPKYTSPPKSALKKVIKKIEGVQKRAALLKKEREKYYKQICKPLKIVLVDFRLHQVNKNNQNNKTEIPITLQLILSNMSTKEMEIYTIQNRSTVTCYLKVKECTDEKLKVHINKKEKAKFKYCCWYDRKNILNILQNTILKNYSTNIFKFLNRPHVCAFGQCRCCCAPKDNAKSIFDIGRHSSAKLHDLEKINLENLINRSLKKYCELNYERENFWHNELLSELNKDSLVSKAIHYERKGDDNTKLPVSDMAENGTLDGIIQFMNTKPKHPYKDVYFIDKSGNVIGHEQSNNVSYDGRPSYVLVFSPCCWLNRSVVLSKIAKSHNIQSTALQYMNGPHRCSHGQCNCCCKKIAVTAPIKVNKDKKIKPNKQNICSITRINEPTSAKVDKLSTDKVSAEVSVDVLISTILERFKDVRLSINENGKVAVSLKTPVDSLSSAELKVLSQILSHAQKTVTELGIRSSANGANNTLSTNELINHLKLNPNKDMDLPSPTVYPPAKNNIIANKPTILNYYLDNESRNDTVKTYGPVNMSNLQSQSAILGFKNKEYVQSFQSLNSLPIIQNVYSVQKDYSVPVINDTINSQNFESKPWYRKPEEEDIEKSSDAISFNPAIELEKSKLTKRKPEQQATVVNTAKIRVLSPTKIVASNNLNTEKNNPVHSVTNQPLLTFDGKTIQKTVIVNNQPLAQNNVCIKNQPSFQDEFISMTQKMFQQKKQTKKYVTKNKEASKEVTATVINKPQPNVILNPVFLINPMQPSNNKDNSIQSGVGQVLIPTVVQVPSTASHTILQPITTAQPGVEKPTILEAALTNSKNDVKIENTPFTNNTTPVLESIVIEDDDLEDNCDEAKEESDNQEDFSILGM